MVGGLPSLPAVAVIGGEFMAAPGIDATWERRMSDGGIRSAAAHGVVRLEFRGKRSSPELVVQGIGRVVQDAAVPQAEYVNGSHGGSPCRWSELLTRIRHNSTVGS